MDWLEAHGLTLALLTTVLVHWGRMEVKLALVARDLQWVRAGLTALGFRGPNGKGG